MTTFRTHPSGAVRTLVAVAATAALLASAGVAVADQRGDHQGGWGQDQGASHHWQRGERMGQNDWGSAQPVDYRAHHLRHPPRGYEWRQSNGEYVLGAVATGLIAATILSSGR
jgi:Ni/Co efflux regulator RcnB